MGIPSTHIEGPQIDGLELIPGFADPDLQWALLAELEHLTWAVRYDHFGTYQVLQKLDFRPVIEGIAQRIEGILGEPPQRVQINRYETGKGINDHEDHPQIRQGAVLSLGASCVVQFRRLMGDPVHTRMLVTPGDLYVFREQASRIVHGIEHGQTDTFHGRVHERIGRRTAVVYATLHKVLNKT